MAGGRVKRGGRALGKQTDCKSPSCCIRLGPSNIPVPDPLRVETCQGRGLWKGGIGKRWGWAVGLGAVKCTGEAAPRYQDTDQVEAGGRGGEGGQRAGQVQKVARVPTSQG